MDSVFHNLAACDDPGIGVVRVSGAGKKSAEEGAAQTETEICVTAAAWHHIRLCFMIE